MKTKNKTSKELFQELICLVESFQAEWKANENDLNNIPYDGWPCTGLPFFRSALKLIKQLKKNQLD